MMLNNGCLCCTVRDDLVGMLEKLVSERGPAAPGACLGGQPRVCMRVGCATGPQAGAGLSPARAAAVRRSSKQPWRHPLLAHARLPAVPAARQV